MPKIREECGVVAIFNDPKAFSSTVFSLHALQHRGQDSSGIGIAHNGELKVEKHKGYVTSNFNTSQMAAELEGTSAIGHVRYATVKSDDTIKCAHPIAGNFKGHKFLLAHNGHIANYKELQGMLKDKSESAPTDTAILASLIGESDADTLEEAFKYVLQKCVGAYAMAILVEDGSIMAVRDNVGIRPFSIGFDSERVVLASETCAFSALGIYDFREIQPGEFIVADGNGVRSEKMPNSNDTARLCVFEIIYISRPDSVYLGKSVYEHRKEMGRNLAKESNVSADIVVSVPSSGNSAAKGYARESNIPLEDGLVRNHYMWRTFIEPSQEIRERSVYLKHSVNRRIVKDKRVVLIDDSLVRGTTMKRIVLLLREAGAKEIHVRIACPQIKYPDFFGIEISDDDLLLSAHKDDKEIKEYINADSLAFLSIDNVYKALGFSKRNPENPQMSDHYFTNDYPIDLDGIA